VTDGQCRANPEPSAFAWELAQQPIAEASPEAPKTVLTIVRELAWRPGGDKSLDAVLAVRARPRSFSRRACAPG
jgi:hypothetical protein